MELGDVAAVYSTDLLRGALPALDLYRKIVSRVSQEESLKHPVLYCETRLLRERDMGELEGKHYEELNCDNVGTVGKYLYRLSDIPGGESLAAVGHRAELISKKLRQLERDSSETIVVPVITHGCFKNYLITACEQYSGFDISRLSLYRVSGNLAGFQVRCKNQRVEEILPFPR